MVRCGENQQSLLASVSQACPTAVPGAVYGLYPTQEDFTSNLSQSVRSLCTTLGIIKENDQ